VTAFFERITLSPLVYDAARGADALDTLTNSLRAAADLAPAAVAGDAADAHPAGGAVGYVAKLNDRIG